LRGSENGRVGSLIEGGTRPRLTTRGDKGKEAEWRTESRREGKHPGGDSTMVVGTDGRGWNWGRRRRGRMGATTEYNCK